MSQSTKSHIYIRTLISDTLKLIKSPEIETIPDTNTISIFGPGKFSLYLSTLPKRDIWELYGTTESGHHFSTIMRPITGLEGKDIQFINHVDTILDYLKQ